MSGALATKRASHGAGPARHSRRPIKLMIVDDSMVARAVLSRMIDADGSFEIAGIAGTAEDAIEALGQVMVDIVLLDLEMPGAGGLKALPRILEAAKGAKVLIVSSLAEEGAEETVAALALGAADTLPKPGTGRFNGRFSEVLLGKLRGLGYADRSSVPAPGSIAPRPMPVQSSEPLALRTLQKEMRSWAPPLRRSFRAGSPSPRPCAVSSWISSRPRSCGSSTMGRRWRGALLLAARRRPSG